MYVNIEHDMMNHMPGIDIAQCMFLSDNVQVKNGAFRIRFLMLWSDSGFLVYPSVLEGK